jgi:membrane protease YdiL (CAAX protease family)
MVYESEFEEEHGIKSTGNWYPYPNIRLALIIVLIVSFIFYAIMVIFVSIDPWWIYWGNLSLYLPVYYLLYGCLLLVLAGILATNNDWHVAFDNLQLTIRRTSMNYFMIGLIVGAFAAITLGLLQVLVDALLFSGSLSIGLIPSHLELAVILIIPYLVLCIGLVALIQGYFQRKLSNNSADNGIFIAALIYTILPFFSNVPTHVLDPFFLASSFIMGIIIAYLFIKSKSLYLPIGFLFGWGVFGRIEDGFMSVNPEWFAKTFLGFSANETSYVLRLLVMLLVLALIWYFSYILPEKIDE